MRKYFFLFLILALMVFAVTCTDNDDDDNDDQVDDDDDDATPDDDDDDTYDDDTDDDDTGDDDTVDDDTADDDTVDDDTTDDDTGDDDTVTPHIKDDLGREMIIHATNYMGLEYGGFNHTQEDYDRIADWGFTHVRLPISWRYMEPEPGVWEDDYLVNVVLPDLDMAEAAGLQVIIDMHQWQWCSSFGGNGSPDWACEGLYPENTMGMIIFAADFWSGELHEHWAQAWDYTWQYTTGHPAVFAYDLFNEPWAGVFSVMPSFDMDVLQPFYEDLIATLRTYDEDVWAGVEPQFTRDFLPTFLSPIDDPKVLYMPHNYTCGTGFSTVGYWCGAAWMAHDKRVLDRQRRKLRMPTIIGEWGIASCVDGVEDFMRDATTGHDRWALSESVWCYHRDDCGWGLLDSAGEEKDYYLDYLIRPYPRAVAGHIESYGFDFDTKVFTLTYHDTEEASGDTLIFVPERQYPDEFNLTSSDPNGTWSSNYDAVTEVVTYTADPNSDTHTITISPQR